MRLKLHLFVIGMMIGLFFFPDLALTCPKCFGASAQQVLNAYYVSIAFMALIPVGIIGGILTWLQRQNRRHLDSQK
jgi:hypothetical protein